MKDLSIEEQKYLAEITIPERNFEEFKKILSNKNVNSILDYDDSNWNLLLLTSWFDFKEATDYLIDKKIKIDYSSPDGMNVLLVATHKNNINLVEKLLNLGFNVDCQDENGLTPLMLACEQDKAKMVALLLEHKADYLKKDFSGKDCLSYAHSSGNYEIISLIEKLKFTKDFKEAKNNKTISI